MPIDINGYVLSNVASDLKFGASNTKIVAANYGIRDPTLPAMCGSATGGGSTYKIYPFPVNDSNQLNIGSPWSTTNYRFTAPVAGVYYISYGGIVGDGNNTANAQYYSVIVNGVLTYHSYKDTTSTWELHHIEVMFDLQAGDTVAWAMNIAPGAASAAAVGGYQSNHNTCTIWLVG